LSFGAVDLERAADEEPVADVPGVVAPLAPDREARGAAQLELLALVEDVLLQLFPVVVPAGDHLVHERVEVGLGGEMGRCRDEADGHAEDCRREQQERLGQLARAARSHRHGTASLSGSGAVLTISDEDGLAEV
jgi:hypothetical protein